MENMYNSGAKWIFYAAKGYCPREINHRWFWRKFFLAEWEIAAQKLGYRVAEKFYEEHNMLENLPRRRRLNSFW